MTTAAGSCGVWLTLQPPDIIEQGKWLNILIKETGCGSPVAKQQPGGVASDEEGKARSLQPHSPILHLAASVLDNVLSDVS